MPLPASVLRHSRYLQRLLAARPDLEADVAARMSQPVSSGELEGWLAAQSVTAETLKPALRRFKQWAYARVAARDLAGLATLAEVTETMTLIAELALAQAHAVLHRGLVERYGEPRSAAGDVQPLIVIGMGKLGGRELNVSSDIDLIFVYPEDGETRGDGGERSISNFEFFTRLGRALINSIADLTEDGQVFRVDMRLRPNGDSGPLVCSFDMLEDYFITQGREWERYAWIKARPLAASDDTVTGLEKLRRPFVFRKYLDFGSINAMRQLHAQIRREVAKKDMADNVKLGPGGIREIEFIAQVFQLIRGGRDTPLQARPTLAVLKLLAERGTLAREAERELAGAYEFLRRTEHRLQYLDDAQTHNLPADAEDRQRLAESMGFTGEEEFLAALNAHRSVVSRHFDQVFSDPTQGDHHLAALWSEADSGETDSMFERLGYRDPPQAARRLASLRGSPRYRQLSEDSRARFDVLVPRLVEAAAGMANPDETLARGIGLLESVSRRAAYLALLQQYPQALQNVAQLVSSSSWAAEYLQSHPVLLDELLDPRLLELAPDWPGFATHLAERLEALEPDTERQMDALRESHHAQVFRLLTQDIAGRLSVETLADHMSALADLLLSQTLDRVWRKLARRHRDEPKFAIISYGKLGGKELGYASDLDLVFLYDDAHPDAGEIYARLGTRLNTWLSAQTSAGQLFETDLRLRPNGESGLVVSSLEAFRKYQCEAAWLWEHQALTRARFSAGDGEVGAAFEQIRVEVLRTPRDLKALRVEVTAMRRKMMDAHATRGDLRETVFDLKHDPGGLVDVEFIVQYLVLGYSHRHAELTRNLGNLALLRMAGELDLIPSGLAESVRVAYREYRRLQHGLRLNGARPRVAPETVADKVGAVRQLWENVFFDSAPEAPKQ